MPRVRHRGLSRARAGRGPLPERVMPRATAARKLAEHFHTLDKLMDGSLDDLQRIPDVGDVMGQSIDRYFQDGKNRALIERLRKTGLNFGEKDEHAPKSAGAKFAGTTWV